MAFWMLLKNLNDDNGQCLEVVTQGFSETTENRHLDVRLEPRTKQPNYALLSSMKIGVKQGYTLLSQEGYISAFITARFRITADVSNVSGNSADVLFAITMFKSIMKGMVFPPLAATGRLGEHGEVLSVEGVPAKLTAALATLPSGAHIFYPEANDDELSPALKAQADAKGIALHAVARLDQIAEQLGIAVNKVYTEPYRGLEAFRAEDRKIYFGRQREIIEIKDKLLDREAENKPGLLIIAASGAGKTSLVQAGLLPALQSGYLALEDRPIAYQVWQPSDIGATLTETALIHSLCANWQTLPEISSRLISPPPTLTALAQQLASHWPPQMRLLWVMNQMEELFTLGFSQELLKTFGEFLLNLQQQGVWLIATLRSDFYDRYQAQAPLLQLFGSAGSYDLPQLDEAALRQIIEEPARLAGVQFEIDKQGISLVDRLLTDMRGNIDALPLLEFVLQGLFQQKSVAGIMSYASYDQLGGLLGAIGQQAEQVFAELSTEEQDSLTRLLWKLAAPTKDGSQKYITAQTLYLRDFADNDPIHRLIAAFVKTRLLIQENEQDNCKVKVAHEALLSHWPKAKENIDNFIVDRQLEDQLQTQATDWQGAGQASSFLITGGEALIRAEGLLARRGEMLLADDVFKLIQSSIQKRDKALIVKKRNTRRKIILTAFVFIVVSGLAGVAWIQKAEAEKQKVEAQAQTKIAVAEKQKSDLFNEKLNQFSSLIMSILSSPDDLSNDEFSKKIIDRFSNIIFDIFNTQDESNIDRFLGNVSTPATKKIFVKLLDPLIANTESMNDEERQYWRDILPSMTSEQTKRLLVILSTEKINLKKLEKKYESEITQLNDKHLHEFLIDKINKVDSKNPVSYLSAAEAIIDSYERKYDDINYDDALIFLDQYKNLSKKYDATMYFLYGKYFDIKKDDKRIFYFYKSAVNDNSDDLGVDKLKVIYNYFEKNEYYKEALNVAVKIYDYDKNSLLKKSNAIDEKDSLTESTVNYLDSFARLLYAKIDAHENTMPDDATDAIAQADNIKNQDLSVYLRVQNSLSAFYSSIGDIDKAYQALSDSLNFYETAPIKDDIKKSWIAGKYGSLSWYQLLLNKPKEAITSAQQGLKYDPDAKWINGNLAHGYLFTGQLCDAEKVNLAMLNEKVEVNNKSWRDATLGDFAEFAQRKLNYLNIDKIKSVLETGQLTPECIDAGP